MLYTGGVIKFTFIGFFMRKSCWIIKLETETTSGLIGCADAEIGVYSCPYFIYIIYFKWDWFLFYCIKHSNLIMTTS